MTSRCRWILAAVVLAVAATSVPVDAAPRVNRKVLKATIDGKRFKPTRQSVGLSAGGGTVAFLASGARVARSLRKVSKTLLISCVNDLSIQTFPFTTTDCLASYGETKLRPPSTKLWMTLQTGATEVTFDSYDGIRIAGRFHAVVPAGPSNPELPAVTIEGEFRGPVEQGDPSR